MNERPLDRFRELVAALDRAGVEHCHWRGAIDRERALRGDGALELLVARDAFGRAVASARALGWKRLRHPLSEGRPGVDDYVALDTAGRPLRLRLATRVWIGSDAAELSLPVEQALLRSRISGEVVPLAAPEVERALLALRHALEPDGAPHASASPEIDAAQRFLAETLPELGAAEVRALLEIFARGGHASWRLRRRLARALCAHRRHGPAGRVRIACERGWLGATRLLRRGAPPRSQTDAGGALVALLGSDGSGKSSLLEALRTGFEPLVDVTTGHLGKPPRSLRSRVVGRVVTSAARLSGRRPADLEGNAEGAPFWLQWLKAHQHLALARNRERECRRLQRAVGRGALALSDRYPRPDLTRMESPAARRLSHASEPRIARLAEREEAIYRSLPRPERSLLLCVSPETAVRRQPDEEPDFVRARAREIVALAERAPADLYQIDAERPFSAVVSEARRVVWEIL